MRRTLTALVTAMLVVAGAIVSPSPAQAATFFSQYLGHGEPDHGYDAARQVFLMREGDRVNSLNGWYSLRLQTDGNMVLYDTTPNPDRACGVSHTTGLGAIEARLQYSDSNFVLYAGNSGVWASTSTHLRPQTYLRVNVGNDGRAAVIRAPRKDGDTFRDSTNRDTFWSCT